MGLPTIILGKSTDRRVFDLYNALSKRYNTLIWDNYSASTTSILYPKACHWKCQKLSDVLKLVELNPVTDYVWLPLVEDEIEWLLSNATIPTNLKYLLPTKINFSEANDKKKFTQKFEQAGLTPRSFSISELAASFPVEGVVVKPRIGKGAVGRYYLNAPGKLPDHMDDMVIQERLRDGKNVIGSFVIAQNGIVIKHYQHRRIRTFPSKGGVSVYAETVQISAVRQATEEIIKKMHWSGLCMLEFLQDQHGRYKAIECNPRIWGSVLLDEFSGNHLVDAYIMLCLGKEVQVKPILPHARIKWLFPYEFFHIIARPWSIFEFYSSVGKNTCYVGFTYSSLIRSILFILLNIFSRTKWVTLFKKTVKSS